MIGSRFTVGHRVYLSAGCALVQQKSARRRRMFLRVIRLADFDMAILVFRHTVRESGDAFEGLNSMILYDEWLQPYNNAVVPIRSRCWTRKRDRFSSRIPRSRWTHASRDFKLYMCVCHDFYDTPVHPSCTSCEPVEVLVPSDHFFGCGWAL